MLVPEVANLGSIRLNGSFAPMPTKDMRMLVDVFLFTKLDSDAPLSVSSTGDSFVGVEIDFSMTWNITSDLSWDMQYGIFIPGDAIPDKDPMHIFYTGISYGF